MDEQTPTIVINNEKPKNSIFSFKNGVIVALILVIIFLFTCNPMKWQPDNSAALKIEKKRQDDSTRYAMETALNEVRIMQANNREQEANREKDSAWKVVKSTEGKLSSLQSRYKVLRDNLPDTGMTELSYNYIASCDSCFDLVDILNGDVERYKGYADEVDLSRKQQLELKDTTIAIEKRATAAKDKEATGWQQLYYSERTYNAPRTKFLPGLIAGYDVVSGLTYGIQANLLLKNGTLLHANAQTGKTDRVEVGVSKTISFRKKR